MKLIEKWFDGLEKKINNISNRKKRILIRSLLVFCLLVILISVAFALMVGILLLQTSSLKTRQIFYGICLFLCLVFTCLMTGTALDNWNCEERDDGNNLHEKDETE